MGGEIEHSTKLQIETISKNMVRTYNIMNLVVEQYRLSNVFFGTTSISFDRLLLAVLSEDPDIVIGTEFDSNKIVQLANRQLVKELTMLCKQQEGSCL